MLTIAGLRALAASWWKLPVGMLLSAAICLPLGYCKGERAASARYDAARAVANVETVKVDGAAKEIAANERRVDDALVNEGKEKLLDAVQSAPPSVPDVARVALGCARLRAQGTDTAAIPACR